MQLFSYVPRRIRFGLALALVSGLAALPAWSQPMQLTGVQPGVAAAGDAVQMTGQNFYQVDHLFAWGWNGQQGFHIPLTQGNQTALLGRLAPTPDTVNGATVQLWAGQRVQLPNQHFVLGGESNQIANSKIFVASESVEGGFLTALSHGNGASSQLINGELVVDLPQLPQLMNSGPLKAIGDHNISVLVIIQTRGCEPGGDDDQSGSQSGTPYPRLWAGDLLIRCMQNNGVCSGSLAERTAEAIRRAFGGQGITSTAIGSRVVLSSPPQCGIEKGTLRIVPR